jgi:hypothetical protein
MKRQRIICEIDDLPRYSSKCGGGLRQVLKEAVPKKGYFISSNFIGPNSAADVSASEGANLIEERLLFLKRQRRDLRGGHRMWPLFRSRIFLCGRFY